MTATANYRITDAIPGEVISGLTTSALASLPAGTLVTLLNPAASPGSGPTYIGDDSVQLQLCNGFGPVYLLERDTLANGADVPVDRLIFDDTILIPTKIGQMASAREAKFIEVEGSDLILTSTGQALSGSTTVGVELTTSNGKWALRTHTATQEVCGILRAQLNPEDGTTFRFYIQIINTDHSGVAS